MLQRLWVLLPVGMLVVMVGFLVTGCAKPPGRAVPDQTSRAEYPQVEAMGYLSKNISFSKPTVRGGQDEPLRVSVPVRLTLSNPREVQYRFMFFGSDGAPVGEPMDWRYEELPARSQVFLEGTAMSREARDWRLVIRPIRLRD
jgi:uncharacterized protein YcfL